MRRWTAFLALLVASVVTLPAPAQAAGIGADPVATGLAFPSAFTFAPDGRIFYGQAFTLEVHLYDPSTGSDTLFYAFSGSEGLPDLMGIVLAPAYPTQPFVYVYLVRLVGGTLKDQIVRLRDAGGVGTQPRVIYQADAVGDHHGGRMLFGSDGMLWVATGEEGDPALAQDLTSTLGKMLRMTPTGNVPPGNPFGTLVWAYGLRNSFGWDFDPQTGLLWLEDNGPECNDEIDLIGKGRNYGWGPTETCSTPPPPPRNTNQDGPNPVLPLEYFTPTTAPTGVGFCEGCGLTGSEGHLFYGNYNTFDIHEVVLTANRRGIASDTRVYRHTSFVLSIERGPDGALYFSDDTAIYRLVQT
jgi:glucose/arabinose dehydrogenase